MGSLEYGDTPEDLLTQGEGKLSDRYRQGMLTLVLSPV